ncbi:phosphatidylinositol transfer protein PDR17-like isoform X2 [Andrographis paniculata]|uniref:phosphatidylinositol transfer protein PDR17-like isoform X2 n=1 Tax=Andrographis paniculata TaxID=175694 RepID=UPI0021E9A16E|nr:phosphatidylinositol transfer protein PDR17-like isoform X2 [Andrographis paniculata]
MLLMGKSKDQVQKEKCRVQSVLDLLKRQAPLTVKQEKFCNNACVERFLKAKGDSVKKAAKHLRNCLAWRDSIDNLMADEFSTELAEGVAYVAGHDDELKPVMIFRIKQEYYKYHSQKLFTRLVVFTIEVAIKTMAKTVEQFVILFDASLFRSASAFMNMLMSVLKIIADYYPGRLHRVFVVDPPSLFSYLWKGVKPFLDLAPSTTVVSSLDYEESRDLNDMSLYRRPASTRFDHGSSQPSVSKLGQCSSSRFAFTVSQSFDSLKPWHLSLTDTSAAGPGPAISPHNARSLSFAPRGNTDAVKKSFFPSTPMPQPTQKIDPSLIRHPTTPKPSFLHSPAALFFRKNPQIQEPHRDSFFLTYLKFHRRPYDEMIYRSKMRPPLGGLVSIVAPQLRRSRHVSVSQRF